MLVTMTERMRVHCCPTRDVARDPERDTLGVAGAREDVRDDSPMLVPYLVGRPVHNRMSCIQAQVLDSLVVGHWPRGLI